MLSRAAHVEYRLILSKPSSAFSGFQNHRSPAMALLHRFGCCSSPSSPPLLSFQKSTPNSMLFTVSAHPHHRRCPRRFSSFRLNATIVAESPTASASNGGGGPPKLLLEVKDLTAVISESGKKILNGVNLSIYEGEIHAIMGKNGSGKSTFAKGENLLEMEAEDRSLAGLFLSFQSPVEIPGVSNSDFLLMAYNARRRKLGLPELDPLQFYGYIMPKLEMVNIKADFLNRNVNEGFSGGEKKRNEILQLAVLGAELAILDEIDSGLDVDALRDVAKAVNALMTPTNSVLMITHYRRLLEFIKPDYIHIMDDGRISKTGDISIANILEKEGYKAMSTP
ncbi:ABC transporter, conserved site-containing protein [Cynara cardunculus var. scolymus]|uniref:ABC transporter, conserved site-containing protein n=1 Tax=Cynara cardunculus var. scolymus TaxID=59895 RepID=A0A103Y8L7_CYNCS|nr:ABC transporter, conserved site-containing protein [Cynara cardunculus var. scolymus]